MKRQILLLVLIVLSLRVCANATIDDLYLYNSQAISSGTYNRIWIYDTSPAQTTVNMNGGSATSVITNNTSIFNLHNGTAEVLESSNSSTMNLYGGEVSSIYVMSDSIVNIFGYGFNVYNLDTNNRLFGLSGYWEGGNSFDIQFNRALPDVNVHLHEIPEPMTFILFSVGSLLIRRHVFDV